MHWFNVLWHWVEVHTGIVNESGLYYAFWSGFGSDLGELTIVVAVIGTARKWNCHIKGCWRLAHHEYDLDGVQYHLCHKHHPATDTRPTLADFDAHHAGMQSPALAARDARGRFAAK